MNSDLNEASEQKVAAGTSIPAGSSMNAQLTYKFQRVRERLRQAIVSGELTGKLPGERQLARRFHVNAKTISKALTDLAAEGLLDRSIGRGTFVRSAGAASMLSIAACVHSRLSTANHSAIALAGKPPSAAVTLTTAADRWLVLCEPSRADSPLVRELLRRNPVAQIVHEAASLRPSFLSTFKAVIDFDPRTPTAFLRQMTVRNLPVVIVDREPTTYSLNAVVIDRILAASRLARDLMLSGHRRFVVVERRGSLDVSEAVRKTAQRFAPGAWVDVAYPSEAAGAIVHGATAMICDSAESARIVRDALVREQVEVPGRVALAAMGCADGDIPCTGYYVSPAAGVDAICQSVLNASQHRPAISWLTGDYRDGGTTGPTDAVIDRIGELPADLPLPFATSPTNSDF